ncbi:hypothetical protein IFM89_004002 [Coptis chinensis]|uniref:Uncharacterized protein n=1 Tax=Coptis chinensis TaxID=261450 RepID=A0A835LD94_9MAGN|nr:hypothetical protein IFM89_004002 [Coptis chinensis]
MVSAGAPLDSGDDETVVDFRGKPFDKSVTGGWLAAGLILELYIYIPFRQGVILLTISTTIPSMKPPPCSEYRRLHHECVEANGRQLAMLYVALYTIALGGGGIKANVSGFGSDQFDVRDPKEEKAMIFFFNRFYFCISLGSLSAVTFLVYVQDNVGRGWGYGTSAVTMAIAVIILLTGTPFYRYKKPKGSPLTIIWRVFYLAWRKKKLAYPDSSMLNEFQNAKFPHTQRLRCLDKAAILDDTEGEGTVKQNPWVVSTVTEVEEAKMVIKLIPIWSTCILFWTVYSQMTTFSVQQATAMNRNIGSFIIPSGSMSFFLFITILIFTSLNEKLLVPFARKFTQNVKGITSLQRIATGLIFSIAAMVAAAIVEKQRRTVAVQQHIKITVFWLVPQFFLVGAGEAFAYVGQLEFFIREAPDKMKSMSTGLFLSTLSMGFFVSSLLVSVVDKVTKNSWIRNNLNKGKLENFYWLLAVLGVLNFLVFLLFATRHQYKVEQYKTSNKGEELKEWNGGRLADNEDKENALGVL